MGRDTTNERDVRDAANDEDNLSVANSKEDERENCIDRLRCIIGEVNHHPRQCTAQCDNLLVACAVGTIGTPHNVISINTSGPLKSMYKFIYFSFKIFFK